MKHPALIAATAALFALAACDAIRLPGDPPETAAEKSDDTSGTLDQLPGNLFDDTVTSSVEVVPETPASTPTTDTEVAPNGPGTDTEVLEITPETTEETALQPESVGGMALAVQMPELSLASLNAASCGRPAGSPPTPTVATVSGAKVQDESLAGTEAVNGLAATLASFPGIVKLEPRAPQPDGTITSGHCSATRIAQNWFVTAAHCVDDDYQELRLIGDAANLRSPLAKVTSATVAVCHAGYLGTANGYANDLALIRLNDAQIAPIADVPVARYGDTQKPLAPANYPMADMAGWGLTHYGGNLSNDLMSTQLKITADGPSLINVATAGGAGPCVGDSGGPLYITEADGTKTVVGVLSVVEQNRTTGEFCAGDYNGRYTNLQGYTRWISSVMALCDANPDVCK
ncbi:MAG: trypsin-like serine protease [Alphaproteobacteria bacterium]|nr:trypsin-like serine protease [Alphaproteobacteria bacterium]MBU2084167.1 trypsin-like serine protease [Alphaproteobacteria bacterium]MBU2144298.1 trypsin-like serine protease [Alphaproteobacteria bacterium]MBU2196444.1 trypsin-like serine protease [Alphaproteobacteria bacterium]